MRVEFETLKLKIVLRLFKFMHFNTLSLTVCLMQRILRWNDQAKFSENLKIIP
mgnify:CR=1 FL=1|jgi:hypothetical protein